jgi:hypothetical protein
MVTVITGCWKVLLPAYVNLSKFRLARWAAELLKPVQDKISANKTCAASDKNHVYVARFTVTEGRGHVRTILGYLTGAAHPVYL